MAEWNQHSAATLIAKAHGAGRPLTGALRELQDSFSYIDERAIALLADHYNLSPAEIHGVISYYADFKTRPAGRHTLRLCQAEACQAVGARALREHAQHRLGVKMGETTSDGQISLEAVYCLGLCANGPAGQLNDEAQVQLDSQKLDALITSCRKEKSP